MTPMLNELLRWQALPHQTSFSERWRAWAHTLVDRHAKTLARSQASPMVLLLPFTSSLNHSSAARYLVLQWRPKFHATIAPAHNTTQLVGTSESKNIHVWGKPIVLTRGAAAPPIQSTRQPKMELAHLRTRIDWHNSLLANVRTNRSEFGAPSTPRSARLVGSTSYSALNRTRNSLSIDDSIQIVKRLILQTQRIESRIAVPSTTVQRQAQAAVESRPQFDEVTTSRHASTQPDQRSSAMPAAINLQQLTDQILRQIDNRFIAYKERMGKLF